MNPQIPGFSREVHFMLHNGQHRTVKVINTNQPETPTLKIELDPFTNTFSLKDVLKLGDDVKLGTGYLMAKNVPYDEMGRTAGGWHWPEGT